ncbi:MAG: SDR family NAD(P)-dependent oxidoreductase [Euryarchaeota archaeon]|nr:SDR family NAD(P)-dependent oxidoreductase [Euryarchaeota archaeon]
MSPDPNPATSLGTPHPVLIESPPGTTGPGFAAAVARHGAIGLIDLTTVPDDALHDLRSTCGEERWERGALGMRLDVRDHVRLQTALRLAERDLLTVAVITQVPAGPTSLGPEIAQLRGRGVRVLLEADRADEARSARDLGVAGLVVRAEDTGDGKRAPAVKEITALREESGLPVYAEGGIGPGTLDAVAQSGAEGVLLTVQAWSCPEAPRSDESRDALEVHPDRAHAISFAARANTLEALIATVAEAFVDTGIGGSPWLPRIAKIPTARTTRPEAVATPAPAVAAPATSSTPADTGTPPTDPPVAAPAATQPTPPKEPEKMEPSAPAPTRPDAEPETTDVTGTFYDLAEGVAIIGMGCVLPGAPDVATFWQNVVDKKDHIIEVPKSRWDPDIFYDPDGKDDKSYTRIGGFVTEIPFNPIDFRIPPNMADQLDGVQKMTLVAARQAFLDAGYLDAKLKRVKEFDPERTAVILGNAMGGEVQRTNARRIQWPFVAARLRATDAFQAMPATEQETFLARFKETYLQGLAPITEDTMPGELSNIVSGRVANVFDLLGKNHTVDAACASSFAAMDGAIKSLVEHEFDLVLTGGADRSMDIDTYIKFCKIGALSATGSTPFDARANGFVMGEGAAVFLLKRLSDAIRDGDKIHGVIRGIGASSDGKGKGITAPNKRGQVLAVKRAIEAARIEPGTLQYIEAHGTSTRVGDVVEIESLQEALVEAGFAPGSVGIGSVKSQIGHLKSGAGAAGLLKTVLGLEHKTLPPSLHFETPNPNVDWSRSPFRVVSDAEPWPEVPGVPRRAGVSSFGFGGTNFHVIVEEYLPDHHAREIVASAKSAVRPATRIGARIGQVDEQVARPVLSPEAVQKILAERASLEGETLVIGGASQAEVVARLKEVATGFPTETPFSTSGTGPRLKDLVHSYNVDGVKAPARVAIVAKDLPSVREQAEFALSCLDDPRRMKMAPVKGVFAGQGAPDGKIAFLFPGQGSQYAEMLRDLHDKYAIVRDTFAEADDIMAPLIGKRLTDLVFPVYDASDAAARERAIGAAEEALRQTEICQPAVLTADIAIWRLLRSLGIEPDVVAGHSLGEYAALVAAGILRFEDALHAVSARGKEMANVDVPDLGKMASITAPFVLVEEVLAECEGYVIPANKNCPAMTVIAGSSAGVDEAVERFQKRGIQAQYIPVSAAFHSAIVAPASEPLRRVLSRLSIRPNRVPVYANVTGRHYERQGDGTAWRDYVLDMLAKQVASPVEWTRIIEHMHQEGVRTFIEVGPKRALTGFVANILEGKEHAPVATNHPKKGGVWHINETYAILAAQGHMPKVKHPQATSHYTPMHLDPTGATRAVPVAPPQVVTKEVPVSTPVEVSAARAVAQATDDATLGRLAGEPGFDAYLREQAPMLAAMLDAGWKRDKTRYSTAGPVPVRFGTNGTTAPRETAASTRPGFAFTDEDLVVSGVSVGLPGKHKELFDERNIEAVLTGENFIDLLDDDQRRRMLDKNIVRLTKGSDGSAGFQVIDDVAQVIKLAARLGRFDLPAEYGIDGDLSATLDITTKMAVGAAIEALKDAGIPLVRGYVKTSTGSWLPGDWALPTAMQEETGVIFASAFPGYDNLLDEVGRHLAARHAGLKKEQVATVYRQLIARISDPDAQAEVRTVFEAAFGKLDDTKEETLYTFNRKFLFNVLSMGHAQVAQLIKAKGPNTQVNAACSSTTLAVAMAEDWIRTGRCRRVLVVGADDVTSDRMMEWIGAGFLASGAATTKDDVREAALPFDRRRHGMIIGSGAVGLVIEARAETKARGMDGLVRILATQVANSAFHGSRLDVHHIADQMDRLVATAEARYGLDRDRLAGDLVFMSHETYTPARGGSASAEVESLRRTFGDKASQVVVANTKGFTGHPMGAGIEDAVAIKALQLSRLPPIANHSETDPELGVLNLSPGGEKDLHYTLRLAAGFGSQIALWIGEAITKGTERIVDSTRHQAWLRSITGQEAPVLEVVNKTLRVKDAGAPPREAPALKVERPPVQATPEPATPTPTPAPAVRPAPPPPEPTPTPAPTVRVAPESKPTPAAAPTPAAPAAPATPSATPAERPDREAVLEKVIAIVAEKTGYPVDTLEPELDMEADLGIDTVKQAELFGILRETYAVPQEEGMQIKDYPTLNAVAGYLAERIGDASPAATPPPAAASTPTPGTETATTPTTTPAAPTVKEETAPAATVPAPADGDEVLRQVVTLIAEKTGYPEDMLEPELDMEADLGIDTVKQAELFGILRETHAIPQEEGMQIKDYPTIRHVADYLAGRMARAPASAASPAAVQETPAAGAPTPHVMHQSKRTSGDLGLDDGAPVQKQKAATPPPTTATTATTATTVSGTRHRANKSASLLDLDDGAPSVDRPPSTVQQTTAMRTPAIKTGQQNALDLDDGAPSMGAPPARTQSAPAPQQAPSTEQQTAPTRSTPTPAPEGAPTAPSAPTGGFDRTEVEKRITAIIAEKTGYPEDMLEPGLDMEGDLGIDTVKQAEVFGEVREAFGLPLPEGLKIADYPTIGHVVGFVLEHAGTTAPETAAPAETSAQQPVQNETPAPSPVPQKTEETIAKAPVTTPPTQASAPIRDRASSTIHRLVPVPVPAPLERDAERPLAIDGTLLVTQDGIDWAAEFLQTFTKEGVQVVLLGREEPKGDVPGIFVPVDLSDSVALERTIHSVRERLGPIGGLIHLASLREDRIPQSAKAFKVATREQVKSLYAICRAAADDLERPGAVIATMTRMGGTFTLPDETGAIVTDLHFNPFDGGATGLTKALAKEFPDARVRTIDLGQAIGARDAARILLTELTHDTDRVEVGYPAHSDRVAIELVEKPTPRFQTLRLDTSDHIVVSGGAQGVTAACLEALLERLGPDDAPAVTVLGRTQLPEDIATLASLDAAALDARKQALLAELRRAHERVTPVMLSEAWSKTEKAIEVHRWLERFSALGARVAYHAVDVTDQDAVAAGVAASRDAFGPVTVLVHGAGFEKSKAIRDKDSRQFDQVFDTKVLGLHDLVVATLDDPLRAIMVMSSVAGRFGNMGQVDYSAANDLAVRYAVALGRARDIHAHGIDWSAWAEVGMATRGGIMTVMEAAGVTPIPVAVGARRFVDELLSGDEHPEVVVAGRLGGLDGQGQVSGRKVAPGPLPHIDTPRADHPLIDGIVAHTPHRHIVAVHTVDQARDPYLDHHRVEGVPYLPGVFGLEAFAETAERLLTDEEREAGHTFIGAEDIQYALPFKLLKDRPLAARVVIERIGAPPAPRKKDTRYEVAPDGSDAELLGETPETPDEDAVATARFLCRLESDFVNDHGDVLGDVRVHFEGTVLFGERDETPTRPAFDQTGAPLYDRATVYDHFFHGPTFQVLDKIVSIEGSDVVAHARFEHDGLFADAPRPRFLTAPLAREAAFQAAGFWALAARDRMSLPAGIRRVTHYGQSAEAPPGTTLVVVARHERDLPGGAEAEYIVETWTPEGVLVDRMEGYRMITTGRHKVPRETPPDDDGRHETVVAPAPAPAPPVNGDGARPSAAQRTSDQEGDWELTTRDEPDGARAEAVDLGGHGAVRVDVHATAKRLDEGSLDDLFTANEKKRLLSYPVDKRRHEHAAGLVAAKHALVATLAKVGYTLQPSDIEIHPEEGTRRPLWRVPGQHSLPGLHLTVSHTGPHAVAAVSSTEHTAGFGLDIERIEERADSFLPTAFSDDEIADLKRPGPKEGPLYETVARYWTIKEAITKGLGTGLAIPLHDIRITGIGPDGDAEVRLDAKAQARLKELGGKRLAVRSVRFDDDHVGAVARLLRD